MCNCKEMWLDTPKRPIPEQKVNGGRHDCDYVRNRNGFIPVAEEFADGIVPEAITKGGTLEQRQLWSKVFLQEMDRLVNEWQNREKMRRS